MAVHREQGSFVVRIELSAEFAEDYEGQEDGNAWLQAWHENVRPRVARAVLEQLRSEPAYSAFVVSRGRHPDAELELDVRFAPRGPDASSGSKQGAG
jgi:hypothetical protein